jgi:pimeloyl-ACP methyl ester carboxylesterase
MTMSAPAESLHRFDVGGYPLAYLEAGSGPPLLLIHGSLADYRAWAQQLPSFAASYRTMAVSLRHCFPERWDGRGNDFSVPRHAADLAAFIAGRSMGSVHVVGHSRGGAVALALAFAYRELVSSLVLADPGGLEALLPDTDEGEQMAMESAAMFADLREHLGRGDHDGAARAFAEALGGEGAWDRRTPEQKQMLLDNIATGPACAERPRFARVQLASLTVPMLLVTGERSPSRHTLMLAELHKLNSHVADLVTIPNAAHAMNRENPAAFNAAVMSFLAKR